MRPVPGARCMLHATMGACTWPCAASTEPAQDSTAGCVGTCGWVWVHVPAVDAGSFGTAAYFSRGPFTWPLKRAWLAAYMHVYYDTGGGSLLMQALTRTRSP